MSENLVYVTPRLVLVKSDLQSALETLKHNHGSFFHLFNLSNDEVQVQNVPAKSTKHKNRGYPFSMKITLQMCMQLDRYFYKGISNAAALYCPNNQFGCCVVVCYMYVSGRFKSMSQVIKYFYRKYNLGGPLPERWLLNFEELFDNLDVNMPPVKILKKVVLSTQPQLVPLFEVERQTRFQELQPVYQHPLENQLQEHYHQIVKANYHTKKPQADYVFKPVVLAGDFKVGLYSYETIKPVKVLTIGFNTVFIDTDQLVFQGSDLYDSTLPSSTTVTLEFDDYCACVSTTPLLERCAHCLLQLKPIKKEYMELLDLSGQFNRNRNKSVSSMLVFGSQHFDDVQQ